VLQFDGSAPIFSPRSASAFMVSLMNTPGLGGTKSSGTAVKRISISPPCFKRAISAWVNRVPYCRERNRKVLVGCTDVEHGEQIDPRLVELARGADLLVHDAQFTAEELKNQRGWGHSSLDQAMQFAEMAGVKRLALTHHDPEHDDEVPSAHRKIV
jgi:hypothetical protein